MMQVVKKKQRHHSLTGRITMKILQKAFKAVKRNRGAAGIDKVSIKMFEKNLELIFSRRKNSYFEALSLSCYCYCNCAAGL